MYTYIYTIDIFAYESAWFVYIRICVEDVRWLQLSYLMFCTTGHTVPTLNPATAQPLWEQTLLSIGSFTSLKTNQQVMTPTSQIWLLPVNSQGMNCPHQYQASQS